MAAITLKEFVKHLRSELEASMESGEDANVQFIPKDITLELSILTEKSGDGNAGLSFKVFSVGAEIEGSASTRKEQIQKLTISMMPVDKSGKQLFIHDRSGESI